MANAADYIASLDNALAQTGGDDIILRRVVGTQNVDVTCRARVDAVTTEEIAAGISQTDLNIIISPTQINNAEWPGYAAVDLPPFDVDPRIPLMGQDKVIVENRLRTVAFVDTQSVGNTLVRINMRVTG